MQGCKNSVFLWIPNIIGYFRVILVILSFYWIRNPILFMSLYTASCLLDVADGHAARSKFGAVLDMVTDRSTTAGLLCHLCSLYPRFTIIFQLLIALDLSSHYMQMYSSLSTGSISHKNIDANQNFLLRLYYTSRIVLFVACALNEAFFVSLYMLAYGIGPRIELFDRRISGWLVIALISAPVCTFKQIMNVIQLVSASQKLSELDIKLKSK